MVDFLFTLTFCGSMCLLFIILTPTQLSPAQRFRSASASASRSPAHREGRSTGESIPGTPSARSASRSAAIRRCCRRRCAHRPNCGPHQRTIGLHQKVPGEFAVD